MPSAFDGINEKLKRANQNIVNLNSEIGMFLSDDHYPAIPNRDDDTFDQIVKAHTGREVPPRFAVLAGEIIYQLRSSLDHLIWLLSREEYRRSLEVDRIPCV